MGKVWGANEDRLATVYPSLPTNAFRHVEVACEGHDVLGWSPCNKKASKAMAEQAYSECFTAIRTLYLPLSSMLAKKCGGGIGNLGLGLLRSIQEAVRNGQHSETSKIRQRFRMVPYCTDRFLIERENCQTDSNPRDGQSCPCRFQSIRENAPAWLSPTAPIPSIIHGCPWIVDGRFRSKLLCRFLLTLVWNTDNNKLWWTTINQCNELTD